MLTNRELRSRLRGCLDMPDRSWYGSKVCNWFSASFWNPAFEQLKLAQAGMFRRAAFNLASVASCENVIIAGDLNSLPDSSTYQFLTKDHADGHGDVEHLPPEVLAAVTNLTPSDSGLLSFLPLDLLSSDLEKDAPLTTLTHNFRGFLDHIFVSPTCKCTGLLSLPTSVDFATAGIEGLPCAQHPSDHLPLIARIAIPLVNQKSSVPSLARRISRDSLLEDVADFQI